VQHQLLLRNIGDVEIDTITLEQLRDHLQQHMHLKASSLGHKVRAIKSLFTWLVQEELLVRNPTLKLKEPKLGKRVPKALTIDELEMLRDSCTRVLEHAFVEFFVATGCRVGEIQRLDRRAIDWRRGCVNVIGKGNKEREVYFGSKARIWLKRYLDERRDTDAALFVTGRQPHRMSIHQIEYIFKRIASQLPFELWHEQMQGPTVADAVMDRILHRAHRIVMRGESMRTKEDPLQADETSGK